MKINQNETKGKQKKKNSSRQLFACKSSQINKIYCIQISINSPSHVVARSVAIFLNTFFDELKAEVYFPVVLTEIKIILKRDINIQLNNSKKRHKYSTFNNILTVNMYQFYYNYYIFNASIQWKDIEGAAIKCHR